MSDVVRVPGTARAALLPGGAEHEVIEDELAATVEEIDQADRAMFSLECVGLVDLHHRQAATFGGERIAGSGGRFLLDQKGVAGGLPLRLGDD